MKIDWDPVSEERYCVDSGRPVQLIPGDRCLSHGARGVMCTTAVRDPRCEHPRLSKNHPYPKCEECGRSGRVAVATPPPIHLIQDDDDQTVCCLRAWAEMTDGLTYEVDAVTCKGNAATAPQLSSDGGGPNVE